MPDPDMKPVRLVALDAADLAVVSAHVQDAVLKVGDIRWIPGEHRCLFRLNRFAWEKKARRRSENERRLAVLHFDRVLAAKALRIRPDEPETVLSLLAVTFEETDAPAGVVTLVFSGDATMRLEVECLEAQLSDVGGAWATHARPKHPVA